MLTIEDYRHLSELLRTARLFFQEDSYEFVPALEEAVRRLSHLTLEGDRCEALSTSEFECTTFDDIVNQAIMNRKDLERLMDRVSYLQGF